MSTAEKRQNVHAPGSQKPPYREVEVAPHSVPVHSVWPTAPSQGWGVYAAETEFASLYGRFVSTSIPSLLYYLARTTRPSHPKIEKGMSMRTETCMLGIIVLTQHDP